MAKINLEEVKRTEPMLLRYMARHYSQPKGFVGRNICFLILYERAMYGAIVAGSATRHLPGREEFLRKHSKFTRDLDKLVNNIFFHIEGPYPVRNFGQKVLAEFRRVLPSYWFGKYGDDIYAFESLVELPRTGEVYRRDGWTEVGRTKGFTCKREGGYGTDNWSGKRVWDTKNLRPKLIFMRAVNG